jgi:hypothetical protein
VVADLAVVEALKGVLRMGERVSRDLAIRTYAVARQAERSIDFALGSQSQWDSLREYYRDERLGFVRDILCAFRALKADCPSSMAREPFTTIDVGWALSFPLRRFVNRFRSSWRLTRVETGFICGALTALAEVLTRAHQPDAKHLVKLRMDLSACQRIIHKHLVGVPELAQADAVEHFCQADHVVSVRMDAIWGNTPVLAASA